MRQLITRARAELAQPQPEGPTDEDLIEIFNAGTLHRKSCLKNGEQTITK